MSTTLNFDAAAAAETEAIYATPDIAATRIAVFRAANPRPGERVLDVGCGPGYLLRELGMAVGEKGRAVGIDLSDPMLAMAQQRCAAVVKVLTEKTDALKIPGADSTFDLACVLQVYAYVRELDDALVELYRALRPGGRAVILDTDFSGVVWESKIASVCKRYLPPMTDTSHGLIFHGSCRADCDLLVSRLSVAKSCRY